jgi:hypothetical protein
MTRLSRDKTRQSILQLCQQQLNAIGLSLRRPQVFGVELQPGFTGWLGLNMATITATAQEINPVVGVRAQEVERIVATLIETGDNLISPPTVAGNIGYIMPQGRYAGWVVDTAVDPITTIDAMVACVGEHGLPYMERHASLESIYEALTASRYEKSEQRAYRIPVVCMLLGRFKRARRHVDEAVGVLGTREDAAAQLYRRFALALSARLDAN